jgi:hypothetical protein
VVRKMTEPDTAPRTDLIDRKALRAAVGKLDHYYQGTANADWLYAPDVVRLIDEAEPVVPELTAADTIDPERLARAWSKEWAPIGADDWRIQRLVRRYATLRGGPDDPAPKPVPTKPKYGDILPLPENVDPLTDREYLRIQAHNEAIYQRMERESHD